MMEKSEYINAIHQKPILMLSDEKISQLVYIIRVIAILCVCAAHMRLYADNPLSKLIAHTWTIIAQFGVPAFLITGGYFYYREKNDSKRFWKKKFYSLVIPWFVASIVTFFISNSLGLNYLNLCYLKWFLGCGTLYYYMTVYVFLLFIFRYITKTSILISMILVSFSSLFFYQINFYGIYDNTLFTRFLNPLNWVGFFAFGILIRRFRLELKVGNKVIAAALIVWVFFSIMECYIRNMTYFSVLNPITQTALLIMVFGLLSRCAINGYVIKYSHFIGSNTLFIYLYHLLIVVSVGNLFPNNIWLIQLIKPILALMIMVLVIYIACAVLERIPYGRVVMKCIGLREVKFLLNENKQNY